MLMRTALDANLRSKSKAGVNSVNGSDTFDQKASEFHFFPLYVSKSFISPIINLLLGGMHRAAVIPELD